MKINFKIDEKSKFDRFIFLFLPVVLIIIALVVIQEDLALTKKENKKSWKR